MINVSNVSVVILAGGRGARFDHESEVLPKPLIEVAGKPILGHIMDSFEAQGFKKFIVLGGYLWERLDEYLSSRYECSAIPPGYGHIRVYGSKGQPVSAHLFWSAPELTTGGRLYELLMDMMPPSPGLGGESFFVLTYGHGICDVDMQDVIGQHLAVGTYRKGPRVTLTAVNPPGRFGVLQIDDSNEQNVTSFEEKGDQEWINGGFMVVDHGVVAQYVPKNFGDEGPHEPFESGALVRLAEDGKLYAWCHHDYWRCMDTRRDLEQIEQDVRDNGGELPWLIKKS